MPRSVLTSFAFLFSIPYSASQWRAYSAPQGAL